MFRTSSRRKLLLLLIVLAGLSLRVWYASWNPGKGRFWDERYALDNVRPIVVEGSMRLGSGYYPSPVFNLPPAVLLIASDALYRATGNDRFLVHLNGEFQPTAYLLVRWLQSLYGALSLLVVFLIGRRLFSSAAGLIAAAAIAFAPYHIHSSGYFKPDSLLFLAVALAFLLSLRAVEHPSFSRFLAAGAGIALATSAKLTGCLIAAPLALGTLIPGPREPRRWLRLIAAAGTALLLFFAANPNGRWYLKLLSGLRRDYAMRAELEGMTRAAIPLKVLALITGPKIHGALLGGLSLLGFAALGWLSWRTTQSKRRVELVMFLCFPLLFTFVYALQTTYFKSNNFLPVTLFSALALGWLCHRAYDYASRRLPLLASSSARSVLALALASLLCIPGFLYAYRSLVRTTLDVAYREIAGSLREAHGRLVYVEASPEPWPIWEGPAPATAGRITVAIEERLASFDSAHLEAADAIIFPARALKRSKNRHFYQSLLASGDGDSRYPARPFVARGPSLVASFTAWTRSRAVKLKTKPCPNRTACWQGRVPRKIQPGRWLSVVVRVPQKTSVDPTPWIESRDARLSLIPKLPFHREEASRSVLKSSKDSN
jgi:4-amino-4-deoxy-L-arabinose transferase-like glycosyltransferase